MTPITDSRAAVLDALDDACSVLSAIPVEAAALRELPDSEIVAVTRLAARCSELAGVLAAMAAGEVARRSAPWLGSNGLAQRTGHRTPEELTKVVMGLTGRDAVIAVKIGYLMNEFASSGMVDDATGEMSAPSQPWLGAVNSALTSQHLSVAAAASIRAGLGVPSEVVTVPQLAAAATQLCAEAHATDPDRLFRRARAIRDELDAAGIAPREEERRQQRSLRLHMLPDGCGRAVWIMDPETFASVKDLYDRATSPKLGGVRFVSSGARETADRIFTDSRRPEQLGSDAFAQLLLLGADADPRFLIGSGAPVVKAIATATAIENRTGHGRLEGQTDPVSIATIERLACTGAILGIVFDTNGQPLDVGREQRLYTRRQRAALAVRDGGCMFLRCERPPSWCEAHHIRHWARDRGGTDTADGILLCKHHHLLVHNNGWEIERDASGGYRLIPPLTVDPEQLPIPMPSKSAAMRDLERER